MNVELLCWLVVWACAFRGGWVLREQPEHAMLWFAIAAGIILGLAP